MNPFARVKVSVNSLAGGILISWEIRRTFVDVGPYLFTVQFGRNVTDDDWENVNAVPLVNVAGAIVVDSTHRIWAQHPLLYFRVRLEAGSNQTYYSAAQQAVGNINRYDWLLMRKIAHSEFMCLHKKFGGVKGSLLKRRTFGTACPGRDDPNDPTTLITTVDWDTNAVHDSTCPRCYGTGLLCGYYDPIEVYIVLTQKQIDRKPHEVRGTVEDIGVSGRLLAWPLVEPRDLFIQHDTDARYFCHKAAYVAEMRSLPVFQEVEMRIMPVSDVGYTLPRTGSPCIDPDVSDSYYPGGYAQI